MVVYISLLFIVSCLSRRYSIDCVSLNSCHGPELYHQYGTRSSESLQLSSCYNALARFMFSENICSYLAVNRTVCSRPPTVAARIKPHAIPRGICGGKSSTVKGSSSRILRYSSVSIFPPVFHTRPLKSPNLYTLPSCHRISSPIDIPFRQSRPPSTMSQLIPSLQHSLHLLADTAEKRKLLINSTAILSNTTLYYQ
jgi:hypothetical protein